MARQTQLELASAAKDKAPVKGLTHGFYRYPARFSPVFASAAIRAYSKPGDVVLDPYMGGGTTVVEAMASGRIAIGSDVNSLSAFVTRVKCSTLTRSEEERLRSWAHLTVGALRHRTNRPVGDLLDDPRTKNLDLPNARYLKKLIALAIDSADDLPKRKVRDYAKCAILRAAQLAIDGRTRRTGAAELRELIGSTLDEMITGTRELRNKDVQKRPVILNRCATTLPSASVFQRRGELADLVVTSPPYPGVHVLYHRWQVDGRRESPAPYWIAGCNDGLGSSHYTFGDRQDPTLHDYFRQSLSTLKAVREVMRPGARMVQMIAFSDRQSHLRRYLKNMEAAGFVEEAPIGYALNGRIKRIWRDVPGRRWHATMKGSIGSSREVVFVHKAVSN